MSVKGLKGVPLRITRLCGISLSRRMLTTAKMSLKMQILTNYNYKEYGENYLAHSCVDAETWKPKPLAGWLVSSYTQPAICLPS